MVHNFKKDVVTSNNNNNNNNNETTQLNNNNNNKNFFNPMIIQDYVTIKQIAATLQGETVVALNEKSKQVCVIKRASKNLYETHISLNGHSIHEDFLKEANIIKLLSKDPSAPTGFIRFKELIENEKNYYLVEEYGGIDLFDYIIQQNKKIKEKKLCSKQWQLKAQYIMGILIQTIHYFHSKHNLCHLDLSLENILIDSKIMSVKICDFGLSLIFNNHNSNGDNNNIFLCSQYAGKVQYKSPEINERKPFDARAADIWALGVILFIMLTGIPPFEFAHNNDLRFQYIINGKLSELLKLWKFEEVIPKDALDLLIKIFKIEKDRITMEQILSHPYFVKSQQLIVDATNGKKKTQSSLLPTTTSLPSTTATTTTTTTIAGTSINTITTVATTNTSVAPAISSNKINYRCQQLSQSNVGNKQKNRFPFFAKTNAKIHNTKESKNVNPPSITKYKTLQQYTISSMQAVQAIQTSLML